MSDKLNPRAAAYLPLLIIGVCLNTLGIALQSLGWPRFVLMGAGLLLLLICVVRMIGARE